MLSYPVQQVALPREDRSASSLAGPLSCPLLASPGPSSFRRAGLDPAYPAVHHYLLQSPAPSERTSKVETGSPSREPKGLFPPAPLLPPAPIREPEALSRSFSSTRKPASFKSEWGRSVPVPIPVLAPSRHRCRPVPLSAPRRCVRCRSSPRPRGPTNTNTNPHLFGKNSSIARIFRPDVPGFAGPVARGRAR